MKKIIPANISKRLKKNPLKTVCVACLILAFIISWSMVLALLIRGKPGSETVRENTFSRNLREYDLIDAPKLAMEGDTPEQIERRLSRLQRQAGSVEEQLSVLKRRRVLAMADRRYIDAYVKAAMEASETFSHSGPLAAVAAEAIVLGSTAGSFSGEAPALLGNYTSRISQNRFDLLNLSVHILAENLQDPARAAAMPGLSELLSSELIALELSGLPYQTQRDLLTDGFLLLAHNGNVSGASFMLNNLLNASLIEPDGETIRMGAEFFYDHNNLHRAVELFLLLDEETSLEMAANALALTGELSGARNIWFALSANPGPWYSQTLLRSIYNLASSSANSPEAESWLEKLFSFSQEPQSRQDSRDNLNLYSAIRYSRLLDATRGVAVLEGLNLDGANPDSARRNPLADLEILRRKQPGLPPTRAASEVWLLLGHHSEDENLYEWAAWYFEHQKLYSETERLLKEASRKGMTGPWLDLHRSFALIRDGKTAEAEKILNVRYQDPRTRDWRIAANLGRIQESRRAISSALEYYQAAAALVRDRPSAAQLQMRLSRCFEALGRSDESHRALEQARELDPNNINIRREHARVFSR